MIHQRLQHWNLANTVVPIPDKDGEIDEYWKMLGCVASDIFVSFVSIDLGLNDLDEADLDDFLLFGIILEVLLAGFVLFLNFNKSLLVFRLSSL